MAQKQLLELVGSVEQIIFKNESNGYTILELNTGDELVVVVGTMPYVSCGEELQIIGTWVNHPTFGDQFKAETFERSKPATSGAILKYLSSGAIKGVGAATAVTIVDMFGEQTLDIIEQEPERLCAIKGITASKAEKIHDEFQRVFGIKELMLYLKQYHITPEESIRIWKAFGNRAKEEMEHDPYCLCQESIGIDFVRADAIAEQFNTPQDDFFRLQSGILYILSHNINNGHTCLPTDKLIKVACSLLDVSHELLVTTLQQMKERKMVSYDMFGEREYIFTNRMYDAETYCAQRLMMLLQYPAQSIVGAEGYIQDLEEKYNIQYADKQKKAICQALEKGILILTGGPGTGKTTTLNAIIQILEFEGEKVLLGAPTGRAAKRMTELTGCEAKTIHRLLQVEWNEQERPTFSKNERNLLECDALILDELSMVDVTLFEGVLRALPLGCRLILVGDSDQLPSVGAGNVLGNFVRAIYSGLGTVFRIPHGHKVTAVGKNAGCLKPAAEALAVCLKKGNAFTVVNLIPSVPIQFGTCGKSRRLNAVRRKNRFFAVFFDQHKLAVCRLEYAFDAADKNRLCIVFVQISHIVSEKNRAPAVFELLMPFNQPAVNHANVCGNVFAPGK